ncbi:TPA: TauD/TfdA family dioxygenase [Pseudomonas aeruginosa]|nr:TauD/TfdA family dioxygenase [Pseudomonas aeruginosa]
MSRVIRFHQFGPPEVLKCEELPTPAPAAGEVLVRVQAIGVSWKDVLWRQNLAPEQAALPSGLGFELAGEVLAVGAGVGDLPLGSRVASFPAHTPDHYPAYGDVVLMPRAALAVYPEVLTPVEASVYYTGLLVAYFGLVDLAGLKAGQTVLITEAARMYGPVSIQLAKALGARVIASTKSAEEREFLREQGADKVVLVFREQRITPAQQIAFSRRFGELQIHVLKQFLLPGHPEILIVSNIVENGQPIGLGDAGKFWHSDLSYKELPSLGSMLHAQELPEEGGDTLFADMHKAWDSLPEALRKAIEGRTAAHSYTARYSEPRFEGNWRPTLSAAQLAEVREVVHPIVRTHPESGRKALFVSEGFTTRIVGLPADESAQLLAELYAHSVRPEHIYRHRWQAHDLVFWDNRSLIHLAGGCPAHLRRKLYRTTIQGDAPF